MRVDDFETSRWRAVRERNGLRDFDDIWNLTGDWVERPNTRHGGFGGVSRCELEERDGERRGFFVKVHCNRLRRSPARPWRRVPALDREFANHARCAALGVASPAPLYYANRLRDGEHRGILVTAELGHHRSLRSLLDAWRAEDCPPFEERAPLVDAIAQRLRALHDAGLVVRSFTPEHLYVNPEGPLDGDGVMLIDLERIRPTPLRRRAMLRDLAVLATAAQRLPEEDENHFARSYLGAGATDARVAELRQRVQQAVRSRREKRQPGSAAQSSAKCV